MSKHDDIKNKIDDVRKSHRKSAIDSMTEPIDINKDEEKKEQLLKMITKKTRLEDTHRRRTFLVKNELLSEIDDRAVASDNSSFKTDFINYAIELALRDFDDLEL